MLIFKTDKQLSQFKYSHFWLRAANYDLLGRNIFKGLRQIYKKISKMVLNVIRCLGGLEWRSKQSYTQGHLQYVALIRSRLSDTSSVSAV